MIGTPAFHVFLSHNSGDKPVGDRLEICIDRMIDADIGRRDERSRTCPACSGSSKTGKAQPPKATGEGPRRGLARGSIAPPLPMEERTDERRGHRDKGAGQDNHGEKYRVQVKRMRQSRRGRREEGRRRPHN